MPLTQKGEEIMASYRKQYGERAEEMFYRSKNAGTITGVDSEEEEPMADQQVPGVITPTAPERDQVAEEPGVTTSRDATPYKEIAPAGATSVAAIWQAANEHRQPEQQLNTPDRSKVGDAQPKEGIARLFDR